MGVKVGVGSGLIPQHKQMAMGSKSQVKVAGGGGLAPQIKGPAQMMKKIATPAAPKPMKASGGMGKGKLK